MRCMIIQGLLSFSRKLWCTFSCEEKPLLLFKCPVLQAGNICSRYQIQIIASSLPKDSATVSPKGSSGWLKLNSDMVSRRMAGERGEHKSLHSAFLRNLSAKKSCHFLSLPQPPMANGAPGSLLAHTCNTYQSPMLNCQLPLVHINTYL